MPHSPETSLKSVLTPQAWELLNSLPAYTSSSADETNITLRRQGWAPETVASVLTQLRLRGEAQAKFGDFAHRMLFTREGLQQSTRLPVAARHAQRFRDAGLEHVADLGCGLGADSLAFASAGLRVTAVEAEETTAAAAYVNLRPFPEAQVVHSTAEDFAGEQGLLAGGTGAPSAGQRPPTGQGVWLDPARRNERSRLWDPEEFSPPLSFVTRLAATGIPLGVKLGPGMPHELIPAGCEAEWISLDGDLVEVVLWFNSLARRTADGSLVRRAATALASQPSAPAQSGLSEVTVSQLTSDTDFGHGISLPASGPEGLAGILWEPDAAIIRAGLVAELSQAYDGHLLDERIAYFCAGSTGSEDLPEARPAAAPAITPDAGEAPLALELATGRGTLARGYRVLEVMKFSAKRLTQWCAEHQIRSVEIKKRGVDVLPEHLRRQILPKRPKGQPSSAGRHATLIITRLGDERLVAVVEPLN